MAEVRFGDIVFRDGQGYSEIAPTREETIKKVLKIPSSSGGGSSSSAAARRAKEAAIKAAAAAQAELLRKAEEERRIMEAKIAAAKTAAEKTRLAQIYVQRQNQNISLQNAKVNKAISTQLRASNLTPIKNASGNVVSFTSDITGRRYTYTDKGIAQYNKDIKTPGSQFKQHIKDTLGSGMSIGKTDDGKIRSLYNRYSDKLITTKNDLARSAARGDINRLADLQRKRNLTASERTEKAKLQKSVAANYRKASEMIGYTMATSVLGLGLGGAALASNLIKAPVSTAKRLPKDVWDALKKDFARVRSGPNEALIVAVEYLTIGGALRGIGRVSSGTARTVSKLNPKYVKSVGGKFVLRKTPKEIFKVKGVERYLEKRVQAPSIKRPFSSVADFIKGRKTGQFKSFTKNPELILKEQTVASGAAGLSRQAQLAGREITAVNAAVEQLTSWLRRKRLIRKPIPGEEKFPATIKALLKKFDSGKKLTTKEFARTNLWLQKNVAPNITLLERSLYLDPASGLRVSRLGIQPTKTATIRDILRGNFRLWNTTGKPQVLIFENAKVAKFPKQLSGIKKKLLADKKLTTAETNKLIRWQVETGSGKLKPIGSTIYSGGRELEVTLAPGEMIKRIKRVGFTYIKGKKVNFVTAEVFKPTKALLTKIKKANLGKLSKTELASLEKSLSKKLGKKVRVETPELRASARRAARRADTNIPVLRVRGRGIFVARLVRRMVRRTRPTTRIRGRKPVKRITRKRRGIPTKRVGMPSKRTVRKARKKPVKKAIKRVARRVSKKTPKRTPKKPPVILKLPKGFKRKTLRKAQPTYYVVEKVRGKLKKLYPKPLTLKDARDYAVYSIDNRLSKTAFFIPLGKSKRVASPKKPIQNYYSKNARKVRPYKIRYGKKKQLVNGYIEKRKYFQDTKGERKQATRLRMKSSVVRKRVVKRKRKITPAQRKILIARLKKARAAKRKS